MAREQVQRKFTLNQRMEAIGFRLGSSDPTLEIKGLDLIAFADIEETLIEAAYEALTDYRVLSVLASWVTVHAEYVIVEKFEKKMRGFEKHRGSNRILDLLAAQAVIVGNHKWKRLIRTRPEHPEFPIEADELQSSIQFQGPNEDLAKFGIQVPKKMLRIRESDVMGPAELGKWNSQYRNRLLFGASWRADLISAIEAGVPNPNRASQLLGCSYEPAYRVFKDYRAAQGEASATGI